MRVLHDWFGCMNVPRSFWRGMREAGVQVKAVNPPASGQPLGVIRRDHRKLLAIDGEYASTGGVCIADGWMVRSEETGLPYRDTAVSVRGPVVADINRAFSSLWGELVEELPRRSALSRGTSRRRERRPRVWSSRNREGCARSGCWSCSRPGYRSASG